MREVRVSWFGCLALIVVVVGAIWLIGFATRVGAVDPSQCEVEPASQWAPQGYICPPIYGEGVASQWQGPGVARNDCTWPWTACPRIRIESVDTGLSVEVSPTMWCMCWVGVTGPQGETARIVDLDPATVAALGLDLGRGLHHVRVYPVAGPARDDSAENPSALPDPPGDGVSDSGSGHSSQVLPDTRYMP